MIPIGNLFNTLRQAILVLINQSSTFEIYYELLTGLAERRIAGLSFKIIKSNRIITLSDFNDLNLCRLIKIEILREPNHIFDALAGVECVCAVVPAGTQVSLLIN